MSITPETIQHIAKLARLGLDLPQKAAAITQLEQMLGVFDALNTIDVTNIAPLFHPGELALTLRPDAITEHDQHAVFQAIAPDVSGQMYLVPKVLEAG
jgi:aspartyl-tRNA(Asn)/glutamyl-tRNA(Gln) amidotransferase subunit C